jgi:hypothetical protein
MRLQLKLYASKLHMHFEATPTGSITDKLLFILEAAATLIVSANKLSAKINKRRSTVTLAKQDVQSVAKQLREAAIMIDNLLAIIEQREMLHDE